jgi:hypothetical protein
MNSTQPAIDYKACIDACQACIMACHSCAAACLQEPDVKKMAACIAQDLECAQVCELAAASMARHSPHVPAICRLCAEICQACADECGKHSHGHCQTCAAACQQCAMSCNLMGLQAH